jgi:hypothetical protein
VRDLLFELVYGELDESSARDVRHHLESCPSCRAELEGLERVRAVMRSSRELDLPAGLEARVMSEARGALGREEPDHAPSGPSGLRALVARLLAPAVLKPAVAAALTALLVAGIAILLAERRGSVVERYAEKPTREPVTALEAPAAPPLETVEAESRPAAPPPYPTSAAGSAEREEEAAKLPAPPPATKDQPAKKTAHKGARLATDEKAALDDATLGGAVATSTAKPPAPEPKMPLKPKPAESPPGADLDLSGTGSAVDGAASIPAQMPSAGYAAKLEPTEAAESGTAAAGKSGAPAGEAAPQPSPAPPPASPPAYGPVPMDMEEDEALEKKKKSKSDKPKWWTGKKKGKTKKKVAKEAAPGASAATEEQPAAPDPFDEAMKKKKKKKYGKAVAILKSLKKNPASTKASRAKVIHQLASCLAAAGDTDAALVQYENLFAKFPAYPGREKATWEAANLYLKAGDKKHARALLEKLADSPQYGKKARKKLKKLK